ncbi:MAG: hypothetical protein A3K90_03545 [Pelodictyon luteolum]|uniref:site-specific DNA-methyltransferase (adenine-specific) n=1 Tax=Pelodictyon luteolum TaxID=1100 RepID=A0A165LD77_PELLU|nr:MAG: hypothetical protein A3K90_03545 [Pelodictyon luteolum]
MPHLTSIRSVCTQPHSGEAIKTEFQLLNAHRAEIASGLQLTRYRMLKKSKTGNKVLFIDATAEFVRNGNKNKLSDDNRKKILAAYIARTDAEHFASFRDNRFIAENDYNISVSNYVDGKDPREVIDIAKLNAELKTTVARINQLRSDIDTIVSEIEGGDENDSSRL